jgi:type VI secretion system protein ImpH
VAGADREPSASLKLDLLKEGSKYEFFQAVRFLRLLSRPVAGREEPEHGQRDRIRIRPELSLRFPPADIVTIEEAEADAPGYCVTVAFLGLYGASSPLPTFYTEDLIGDAGEESSAPRDFLDILNQRLYTLLIRCWGKYRTFLQVVEEKDPVDVERLFSLVGLGESEHREGLAEPYALLRYAGLVTQYPRSALALATLLQDALGDVPVDILPCVRRTITIPEDQRFALGSTSCVLGVDSRVGLELDDRTGKFRLQLGPVSIDRYNALLPGNSLHRKMVSLVRFYLTDPLEYDIELSMADGEAGTVRLGADSLSTLGWDTWIFSGEKLGEVMAVFPPQYS